MSEKPTIYDETRRLECSTTTHQLEEGKPCGHPGCLSHLSHPCEGCGRVGGKYRLPECECWNWCSDGLHRREELLAGHHFRCERFEREYVRRSLVLIGQLYRAMQQWGAEEDGVPDFAWDAWVVAGAVTTGKYQGAKKARTA